MSSACLKWAKLSPDAFAPDRGSPMAAGLDLRSAHQYKIPAGDRCLCLTDIQVALPKDCYGRIAPRSGLAVKFGLDVGAGVIDSDYRGNVGIVLFNFGSSDFVVQKGDRIAQLICEQIKYPSLEEVKQLDCDTNRGQSGFGSTGRN